MADINTLPSLGQYMQIHLEHIMSELTRKIVLSYSSLYLPYCAYFFVKYSQITINLSDVLISVKNSKSLLHVVAFVQILLFDSLRVPGKLLKTELAFAKRTFDNKYIFYAGAIYRSDWSHCLRIFVHVGIQLGMTPLCCFRLT